MLPILGNCVTVARQTLTLFVGVRIPIPQPSRGYKKDIARENPDYIGVFTVLYGKISATDFVDVNRSFSLYVRF